MTNPWISEFWRITLFGLIAFIAGLIIDHVLVSLFIFLAIYFSIYIYNLYRLERWLAARDRTPLPDAGGIWGEVFYHIYKLQRRNQKRKKKLAKMLTRFQESTDAMPDATLVLNNSNEIEWFNRAAKTLLSLKAKQDVGQRIDNLVRTPAFVNYLTRGDFSQPLEIPSHLNHRIRFSISVVHYGKNQKLMTVRDITRVHQLEVMRRDFVANVSHELKTPLTVIAGYLENLIDEGDEQLVTWKNLLQQMQQQSMRMQRIVDDLLLLSRLETEDEMPSDNPVGVSTLISSIVEELHPLVSQSKLNITMDCAQDLWLRGSEKELYSAFSNLIVNAVKYTQEGGEIGIRWVLQDQDPVFEVSDNGIGIPSSDVSRLTERFYRVDAGRSREQGGTGLGLAIVKHVLIRHNGTLSIDSRPGKGSTFKCRFDSARIHLKQDNIHYL